MQASAATATLVLCALATASASATTPAPGSLRVSVGVVLPYSQFRQRLYRAAINGVLHKMKPTLGQYEVQPFIAMLHRQPSPTAILNILCKEFMAMNVSTILFLSNYEMYGRETAAAQYLLQLAGYLGLPVVSWNADNSGLERRASQSSLQLQLAPSLEHQIAAMLSILQRYNWHQFSVVTSQIAGHNHFIQAVRERITDMLPHFKMTIIDTIVVSESSDLVELSTSEARIILLYCTREEAKYIMTTATEYKLTGNNYLWIATQSVIGSSPEAPEQFPVGMLGVHFLTHDQALLGEIARSVRVFAHALVALGWQLPEKRLSLAPQLSCYGGGEARWRHGEAFYRALRNVSVEQDHGKPNLEFSADGRLKSSELLIVNLRPKSTHRFWEQIGVWKSWQKEGLDIKDIVWPGNSHTPPQGVPEKFHLKITFLEEPPYIKLASPDPVTGKCSLNKGVFCRVAKEADIAGMDLEVAHRNESLYKCCSGYCIDLLEKFSEDLAFTYDLFRVEDGKWGAQTNGRWNGLVAALINHHADMVMTSLKINYERSQAIDFSLPFLDTGIVIVVAKRTGIISPTAFLEPFDSAMWMLVALVAIHVAAFTIFFFEWLSPYSYDSKTSGPRSSLCRTLWLVWAILFQAAVNVDCPRSYTARCVANVWAMFALIFLAIYTANLAAFMITREEFHDLSGINDTRLSNPHSLKPPFRFGTIPHGNTEAVLRRNFPQMHTYMRTFNRSNVLLGVQAVKEGQLDAFIYDATVLDYLVGQDSQCVLLTVGSWFAMTGYAVGFPTNSRFRALINRQLMEYRENGELERLQRFWFTGACNKPATKEKHSHSDPLSLEQFFSTFLLLGSGILLAGALLLLERLYIRYARGRLSTLEPCCSLISRSLGDSMRPAPPLRAKKGGRLLRRPGFVTPKCQRPECDALLACLQTALSAAERRVAELEVECARRQLQGACKVHGYLPPHSLQIRSITLDDDTPEIETVL